LIGSAADNLFSAGCTPPILNVFTIYDDFICYFLKTDTMKPYASVFGVSGALGASGVVGLTGAAAGLAGASADFATAGAGFGSAGFGFSTGMLSAWIAFFGHSCSHLRQLRHFSGSM
jgi:hypothetical protein